MESIVIKTAKPIPDRILQSSSDQFKILSQFQSKVEDVFVYEVLVQDEKMLELESLAIEKQYPNYKLDLFDCNVLTTARKCTGKDIGKLLHHLKIEEARLRWGLTGKDTVICLLDAGLDSRQANFEYQERMSNTSPSAHGTEVATIIQTTAPESEIVSYDISDPDDSAEASIFHAYKALDDIENLAVESPGKRFIVNNSWGLSFATQHNSYAYDPDFDLNLKVQNLIDKNIVCVFAAGNSGQVIHPKEPAIFAANGLENVVTVGASYYKSNQVLRYSSHGPSSLGFSKPDVLGISNFKGQNGRILKGTSFAAPVISGAIALLLSRESKMTVADVRRRLIASTLRASCQHHFRAGYGNVDYVKFLRLDVELDTVAHQPCPKERMPM